MGKKDKPKSIRDFKYEMVDFFVLWAINIVLVFFVVMPLEQKYFHMCVTQVCGTTNAYPFWQMVVYTFSPMLMFVAPVYYIIRWRKI